MRRETQKMKQTRRVKKKGFRPELVSCPSPHSHLISVLAAHFYKLSQDAKMNPELGDLAFIYIPTGWCLFYSLFHVKKTGWDGISRGQKEIEQDLLKQRNPCVSVPLGSIRLPCGCNVFVRPSPLITIMFPEECSCLYVCKDMYECVCKSMIPLQLSYAMRKKTYSVQLCTTVHGWISIKCCLAAAQWCVLY